MTNTRRLLSASRVVAKGIVAQVEIGKDGLLRLFETPEYRAWLDRVFGPRPKWAHTKKSRTLKSLR